MSDITACGTPIEFCGHQDGEIAVAVATSDSINSPFHDGLVLIATALGSLANASDMADPANGENLCYVAALPVTQAIEFAGRVLGALSSAIDSGGGRAAIRQRLLAEIVPEALRAELRDALTAAIDAPRLAARETADVVAEFGGVKLLRTTAGEWGTQETFPVSEGDYPADWYRTESAARADFRDTTGTSRCELCGAYRDDHDFDEDGIYTCTDEHKAACEAACAKKGPTP